MSDINEVKLIGKLGADAEVRKTTDAGRFVVLSLATNMQYKNAKGEIGKNTQWHKVSLNNWLGDKASAYKKGDKLFISGELCSEQWEDEKGQMRYSVVVKANACELIAKPPQDRSALSSSEDDTEEEDSVLETAVREACKIALQNRGHAKQNTTVK